MSWSWAFTLSSTEVKNKWSYTFVTPYAWTQFRQTLLQFCLTTILIAPSKNIGKGKVKCTLVQALRLCTGPTAHRGSRGIALHFHDHGTRRRWGVSVTPRSLFTLRKDPVPIVQEAGWAPGPVWTGAENLAPTGIRSPDRPALASHYTDWATRPTNNIEWYNNP